MAQTSCSYQGTRESVVFHLLIPFWLRGWLAKINCPPYILPWQLNSDKPPHLTSDQIKMFWAFMKECFPWPSRLPQALWECEKFSNFLKVRLEVVGSCKVDYLLGRRYTLNLKLDQAFNWSLTEMNTFIFISYEKGYFESFNLATFCIEQTDKWILRNISRNTQSAIDKQNNENKKSIMRTVLGTYWKLWCCFYAVTVIMSNQ